MKSLKRVAGISLILIGLLSFSKAENKNLKENLNLEKINVEQSLFDLESSCRPSSELLFYVETEIVKKSRGFNTVNASVYVLDKVSGASNLLANENLIISNYKDAVLDYGSELFDFNDMVLTNGDKIVGNNLINTPYRFNELIKYEAVYNSYLKSTNKLLKINRAL